jgi:tRNA-dihydrouridine synthase 1
MTLEEDDSYTDDECASCPRDEEEKKDETEDLSSRGPDLPLPRDTPLPVDRDWIRKLLHKHHSHQQEHRSTTHAYVLAPMVDQSDLPFRLLCRSYGTNLCFTPMIHARLFTTNVEYRRKFTLQYGPPQDRPLIAQICGGDVQAVVACALAMQPYCDGIDINCGCPQNIAKRGNYGAFLLEQEEVLLPLVHTLLQHLSVPLSVKVRLLPAETRQASLEASLRLYTKLVDAGVHLLTIHGRTRHHKGPLTGAADWDAIRVVVDRLGQRIPIFANGGVASLRDAQACLATTHADGVMSSEALLEYPALFADQARVGRLALARQYLTLARTFPPELGGQGSAVKCPRTHLHRILHADLQADAVLRQSLVDVDTMDGLDDAVGRVRDRHCECDHDVDTEELSWYRRHRELVRLPNGVTVNAAQARQNQEGAVLKHELVDDAADCFATLFADDDDDYY